MRMSAYRHAMIEYPQESCGLIVERNGKPFYFPCGNIANSVECFVMNPADYVAACDAGEIVAIVHSHCDNPPTPSRIDRQACEASGLPWHILSVPDGSWSYLEPPGYTPELIGREWVHGTSDCYTLIRDWYRVQASIYLSDYHRDIEWWKHGGDLYVRNFADEGFIEVPIGQLEPGDALLMQVGSKVPNHAAVYLGDNVILHHVQGRLSGRDILDAAWRRRITHCLRYADDLSSG